MRGNVNGKEKEEKAKWVAADTEAKRLATDATQGKKSGKENY